MHALLKSVVNPMLLVSFLLNMVHYNVLLVPYLVCSPSILGAFLSVHVVSVLVMRFVLLPFIASTFLSGHVESRV